jgi:hypothetical protein
MDVLKLLVIAATLVVAMVVYYAFDSRCEEAFGRKLLTASSAYCMAAAAWLGYFGSGWRQSLLKSGGDALNGTLLVAIAGVLAIALVAMNYARLGPFFGTLRTALQLLLLPLTACLLPFYPLWVLWRRLSGPIPVRVVRDE